MGDKSTLDIIVIIAIGISLLAVGTIAFIVLDTDDLTIEEVEQLREQVVRLEQQRAELKYRETELESRVEDLDQRLAEKKKHEAERKKENILDQVQKKIIEERESPFDHVKEHDIRVLKNRIQLNIADVEWSQFTDTNSMDPVIDIGANGIYIVPKSSDGLHVGDIVSYESEFIEGFIVHRIIFIGNDAQGWYSTLKGDNLPEPDPGKIRFKQIKRLLIGIVY